MLKVLVQSNYWKQFGPIEILVVFSKQVMEIEDDMSWSQHDSMQNQYYLIVVFHANFMDFHYVEVNVMFEFVSISE